MDNWGAIIYHTRWRLATSEITNEQAITRVKQGLSHCTRGSIGYWRVREYLNSKPVVGLVYE